MLDLLHLEQYHEDNRIEAKQASGGLPESLWETYSAFANTLGGVILLGVEEYPDKSLHPVDLLDPEWLIREFWEIIMNPKKVSVNILREEDVRVELVNGKRIIVIAVPQAGAADKPVYIGEDPLRGSYYRNGEGDYRYSPQEVMQLQREAEKQA